MYRCHQADFQASDSQFQLFYIREEIRITKKTEKTNYYHYYIICEKIYFREFCFWLLISSKFHSLGSFNSDLTINDWINDLISLDLSYTFFADIMHAYIMHAKYVCLFRNYRFTRTLIGTPETSYLRGTHISRCCSIRSFFSQLCEYTRRFVNSVFMPSWRPSTIDEPLL